tara:strand:- start:183 stop:1226 length:1044 start_codon:yes stop_codon:yes gene_type:complete
MHSQLLVLKDAFNSNEKKVSSLEFAKEVFDILGDIQVCIKINDIKCFAEHLKWTAPQHNDSFHRFIDNLIEKLNSLESRGVRYYNLFPVQAFKIAENCDNVSCETPDWLPAVKKIAQANGIHEFTYLYDWNTVLPETIPGKHQMFFAQKLNGDLTKAPRQKAEVASAMKEQLAKLKDEIVTVNEPVASTETKSEVVGLQLSKSAPVKSTPKEYKETIIVEAGVDHDIFVAQSYVQLAEQAKNNEITFQISLNDVMSLLKNPNCYFTGQVLAAVGSKDEKQASLLVLDESKTVTPENVVVVSKELIDARSQLGEQEFDQLIEMKKMMQNSSMSPLMRKIMAQMAAETN